MVNLCHTSHAFLRYSIIRVGNGVYLALPAISFEWLCMLFGLVRHFQAESPSLDLTVAILRYKSDSRKEQRSVGHNT
jgi:hypothetical protein